MDKKIRYGIIGFGTQGSSYCNILTGTAAFAGFPAAPIPPHCTLTLPSGQPPRRSSPTTLSTRTTGT